MIEIRGLKKRLRKRWVLNGLDFAIVDGESVVIIGQSGTGKSVLLKHIMGLMKPDEGSILIDGQDVTRMEGEELLKLRRKVGFLFQSSALFDSLTVAENIALPITENRLDTGGRVLSEIVHEKLRLVGLSEDVEALKPSSLSGGMRKRVALARVLAMEPSYILYDEPTTGLDPVMSDSISHLIRKLQREAKVTSITVTHDMRSAYFVADRIAMLHEGRIRFTGTPQEIINANDPVVRQFVEGFSENGPLSTF